MKVGQLRVETYGLELTLAEVERLHIVAVLRDCDGNVALAAKRLAVHRSRLYRRLRALDISKDGFKRGESCAA
jgi:transcriptional regulator of acetoin/glycerol metabolism